MFTSSKTTIHLLPSEAMPRNDIACFQCGFSVFHYEQVEFLLNLLTTFSAIAGSFMISNQSRFADIALDNLALPALIADKVRYELTGSMREPVPFFDNKSTNVSSKLSLHVSL